MIDYLLSLAQDNPTLFGIVIFNVLLALYITAYISLYLYKRKHPEIMLNVLLWKTSVRARSSGSTIEELYTNVMERMRRERAISKKDGTGRRAREKSLKKVKDDEKQVLEEIYRLYEQKAYSNKTIKNETTVVRDLFDRLLSV